MKRLNNTTILLVEDNKVNQLVARELLASEGATVEIADNGAAGVERVMRDPRLYDIVLMDIQMPIMDGYEATSRLREHLSATELPILAVTAHALEEDRRRARESGMNDHLSKPLDATQLVETILRFVRNTPQKTTANAGPPATDPDTLWRNAGIDRKEALARLLNKEELLRAILLEFYQEFRTFESQAIASMAEGPQSVKKLAHTIKGASGNLGAQELTSRTRRLELAAQEQDPDLQAKLDDVLDALQPVLRLGEALS